MNIKTFMGLLLGFCIGLFCSAFSIPVPAPPLLTGALLVVAMTSGYIITDHFKSNHQPSQNIQNCGGPSGQTILKDK